jgi:hypothetical protein
MEKAKSSCLLVWQNKDYLQRAFYFPSLSRNLLYVNMITNKGNTVVFDYKKCLVINNGDPNIIVAKGVKD